VNQSRRTFLKNTATGFVAAPMFVSRSAWGASDRPAYGMIGTGSRGRWLNSAFQKLGAQCVALCDVYEPNLEAAKKESPADVRTYVDYKELLAQTGIDFVVIATPDHHHCPNLLNSLAARKDVYLEKPLSLNLEESERMVAAVQKSSQIVQIGMHRRSMPFVMRAVKLVAEGVLGRISMAKAMWNWHFDLPLDNSPLPGKIDWDRFQGSAAHRALEPMRVRWWRAFYDYSGGNMTDQGTHLMDVIQWMTRSGPPKSAVCQGKILQASGAEVPNVFSAVFDYGEFIASWTLNYRTVYDFDWSIQLIGEKAAMVLDRMGARIYSDPGGAGAPWSEKNPPELIYQERDRDSGEAHPQNFLDCIKSRKAPNCTVEIAAAAVAGPHMANIALREDRKVKMGTDGRVA
jgi:predicted dehydrogenase